MSSFVTTRSDQDKFQMAYSMGLAADRIRFTIMELDSPNGSADLVSEARLQLLDALGATRATRLLFPVPLVDRLSTPAPHFAEGGEKALYKHQPMAANRGLKQAQTEAINSAQAK